jgi:hypothetical protein
LGVSSFRSEPWIGTGLSPVRVGLRERTGWVLMSRFWMEREPDHLWIRIKIGDRSVTDLDLIWSDLIHGHGLVRDGLN